MTVLHLVIGLQFCHKRQEKYLQKAERMGKKN